MGSFIKDIATGLFGWPVYLFPILAVVSALHKCAPEHYAMHKTKYTAITSGLAVLSVLTHVFSVSEANPLSGANMIANFRQGADGLGGGLIGGFAADILRALIGQVASAIVVITALIAVTMFLWTGPR